MDDKRPHHDAGREPCMVCGSTRSDRERHPSGNVYCVANANGRDRCRERESAKAFPVIGTDLDRAGI